MVSMHDTAPPPPVTTAESADLAALLVFVQAAAAEPDLVARGQAQAAKRALTRLLAQSQAARGLASDVAAMVTDLFAGSDPRRVAEAARGALAAHCVARRVGPGRAFEPNAHADAVRGMRETERA